VTASAVMVAARRSVFARRGRVAGGWWFLGSRINAVLAAKSCNRRAFRICAVWRLTHRVAALCLCLGAVACGGGDDRPSGDPVPVRGNQRLGWDQTAASVEALRAHTFNLYIDDNLATFVDPRCTETRTSRGYQCSGGLPPLPAGRHVVSVTSVLNGIESMRSAPLMIDVLPSGQFAFIAPNESASQPAESISGICATESPHEECFDVNTIASDLGPVTMLGSTPDGRLLFVENETRVRVVANGALLAEPAFTVQGGKSRIVGLGVDSSFSESHLVFLSLTEPARNGVPSLRVTRYREIGNSLGEGITIIDALPFSDDAIAPMVVDREGQLYLALPDTAIATRAVGLDASFAGALVRFDRDGRISRSDTQASPAFSYGYSRPTFITIDPINGRLWTGGSTATMQAVSGIDLSVVKTQLWPLRPFSIDTSWSRADPAVPVGRDLAFSENARDGAGLLASDGQLFLTSLTADGGLIARGRLALGQGVPVRVASGTAGSWYVSVVTPKGTAAIVSLKRRP
jgi:hypothetical protein